MPPCPVCQQPATKRNRFDRRGRQKYACAACRRTFTENSVSAFSGYRWPADVILTAVRWYLAYPLSSPQVLELLAERGIDVSHRTVLNWVQTFGPQLAAEIRRRRRPVGNRWFMDEMFLFRKGQKRSLATMEMDERGESSDASSAVRTSLNGSQENARRIEQQISQLREYVAAQKAGSKTTLGFRLRGLAGSLQPRTQTASSPSG